VVEDVPIRHDQLEGREVEDPEVRRGHVRVEVTGLGQVEPRELTRHDVKLRNDLAALPFEPGSAGSDGGERQGHEERGRDQEVQPAPCRIGVDQGAKDRWQRSLLAGPLDLGEDPGLEARLGALWQAGAQGALDRGVVEARPAHASSSIARSRARRAP
jgi:hypothetical protein